MVISKLRLKLWLASLFIFVSILVRAQDFPSFVSIRSGVSIPVGDYAFKELEGGSYAQPGFNVTLGGAWFFKPKFGVEAIASMNLHPVDVASLGRSKVDADPFLLDVTIRSDPYLIITSMIGPAVQLPLGGRFSIKGKFLGGLLYGKTPYQLYKPEYFGVNAPWSEITSSQDWKLSWQAGIGLAYYLSCVGFVFDTEIIHDQLEFMFNTAGGGVRIDYKTISIINATLGIHLLL
jgi:hypothetical protein